MFTPFEDLDILLADLIGSAREILGDTFVGAYLQGSFALGAADLLSDCDFIIATNVLPTGVVEADLRRLHDEIPTRPGHWPKDLEGSYADTTSLRSAAGLGTPWLFSNHGSRDLVWDTHCNTLHTRWILHHHGITLAGPPITDLVDAVDPEAMRESMRTALPNVMADLRTWARFEMAWTQRYTVTEYCRVLYTLHTGRVASKRGALEWAREHLDPTWRPLLTQVIEDRALGWVPAEPPRPGSLETTYAFAAYAESFAR
ncbi:aminoglycoside adenylyltransferase domain-containing protein [Actinospica robiniae]|uniref:aminoglycoside adenylyltransferase domain-containing protein n=1 Tax=Actinospica robiniae TaxID=304901 RepID=UPI000422AA3C|nr:aminoglycoside adenylyltransferase domain-containing protein [Actinospica robiniae]